MTTVFAILLGLAIWELISWRFAATERKLAALEKRLKGEQR